MKKLNKFLALALGLVSMLFINSCVQDDDYTVPEVLVPAVDISTLGTKTTFANVVSRYNDAVDTDGDGMISTTEQNNADNAVGVFSIEYDAPLYIEGYVVSSDATGNFFEEIIVQNTTDENDLTNDPRRGFKIDIDVRDLSNFYNYGRKVYVKLNGLAIGITNGVLTLGKANVNSLEQIKSFEYQEFVIRDQEIATITPKMVAIGSLVEDDENTLVQFSDAQFFRGDLQDTDNYAGEETDEFDGFRTIESCVTNNSIQLQTSTFADFKSATLAPGKGTITGVYSRDFGDDFDVLIVNSTDDIDFTDSNRCDPVELDCGIATTNGATNLFADDFETQINNSLVTGNGWTNFIEAGSEGWEAYTQTGTNSSLGRSARMSAFGTGDANSIAWLITPAIDLDSNTGITLNFKTSNSFSDDSNMELLFSTDWDGTTAGIATATWGVLPSAYLVQDSDFFGAWFDSGNVDLSCGSGMINIAFKYTGNDIGSGTNNGTYELDEISIDAQ